MSKVLIVDDREHNLLALESVLRPLGVEILKALNGEDALRASLNHEFALAILDVQMPAMDGYELAGLLRSDPRTRHVPIIFLSAVYFDDPYVFRGYSSGAVDFITKPFNPEILLSKARVFLELDTQRAELKDQKGRLQDLVEQLKEQVDARSVVEECLRRSNDELEQKVSDRTVDLAETIKALKTANEQLVARADQLRALAGELTMAEHRQRRQLSKILHDGLQQHLAIAKLHLNALAGRLDSEELQSAAGDVENLIAESIHISRSLSAELSPPVLTNRGLATGLEWLAAWMPDKYGLCIDLSLEIRPELPDDVKIMVFESVRELLFNAVKHAGVSRAKVCLSQSDDAMINVSVCDDGAGFDINRLKPAGDPHSGFGLFSIRERIELIGGRLQIQSAPGKGSRFTLKVPCRSNFQATEPGPASACPLEGAGTQVILETGRGPWRVLIADDHTLFRDALARLVNREGDLEVVGQAHNGREAIELARRLKPDVILMDLSMPEVNGIEATRVILQEASDIRIIGLSMHADGNSAELMCAAGAVDYRNKDCAAFELVSAIRACVPGSNLE